MLWKYHLSIQYSPGYTEDNKASTPLKMPMKEATAQ